MPDMGTVVAITFWFVLIAVVLNFVALSAGLLAVVTGRSFAPSGWHRLRRNIPASRNDQRLTGMSLSLLAVGQLVLAESPDRAFSVMNDHHLLRAEHGLRDGQRADGVGGRTPACIPNHVSVTRTEAQHGVDVEPRIHARKHRELPHGLSRASRRAEVVQPGHHDGAVDGVHGHYAKRDERQRGSG